MSGHGVYVFCILTGHFDTFDQSLGTCIDFGQVIFVLVEKNLTGDLAVLTGKMSCVQLLSYVSPGTCILHNMFSKEV